LDLEPILQLLLLAVIFFITDLQLLPKPLQVLVLPFLEEIVEGLQLGTDSQALRTIGIKQLLKVTLELLNAAVER
jgi:hypothetical protein